MALQIYSGLPKNKVVGMAGILDSSRFIYFLSERLKVDVKKIKSFVLGGHGDTMVAMLNHTEVNGEPIKNLIKAGKLSQDDLNKIGYSLILYDAYRPQSAVDFFVKWSSNINDTIYKNTYYPNIKKSELFKLGYIAYKSSHSRGSTVDVSLVEIESKKEIDMGTIFDYFGVESHTFFNNLSKKQKLNRLLLYEVMSNNGFKNYSKEWWHFTLENEPFQKYFDFPIK